MPDQDGRPDPLGDAVKSETPVPAAAAALITALIGAGVLTTNGVTILNLVLVLAAAGVSGAAAIVSALRVAKTGRAGVTPADDPRNDDGDELVPRTGALLGEVLEQIAGRLVPDAAAPALPAVQPVADLAARPARPARLLAAERAGTERSTRQRRPVAAPAPPEPAGDYRAYYPEQLWPEDEETAARAHRGAPERAGRHRPADGGGRRGTT